MAAHEHGAAEAAREHARVARGVLSILLLVGALAFAIGLLVVAVASLARTRHYGWDRSATLFALSAASGFALAFYAGIRVARRGLAGEAASEQAECVRQNVAMAEFVAMASHELRAPVTVIMGFAETLHERWHDLPDEQRLQFMELIVRGSGDLARLVDDVQAAARIEAGRFKVAPVPFSMVDLARSTIDEFNLSASRSVGLECCADSDLALGDPHRQRQVLANLISNAEKFTGHDGRIDVRVERLAGAYRVSVTDDGVGIASEHLPHLFGKFVRVGEQHPDAPRGTGLGLYICRYLVEAQGGEISVESELGQGTSISYTVPFASSIPYPLRHAATRLFDAGAVHEHPGIVQPTDTVSVTTAPDATGSTFPATG